MKFEKITCSSNNSLFDKDLCSYYLRKVGITREIDLFFDCYNGCIGQCQKGEFINPKNLNFRFEGRKIYFKDKLRRIFINPIKNLFIKEEDFKLLTSVYPSYSGYYIENENTVYMDCRIFFDFSSVEPNYIHTLKHEILHILKNNQHCESKNCLFSENAISRTNDFCSDCQEKFDKLIKEINEVKKDVSE